MAIGWDETNPTDNSIVSQYPINERAQRSVQASAWILEHDDNEGRHSFGLGNTAARDAITSWTSGALWVNTSAGDGNTVIQIFVSAAQWEETGRFTSADDAKLGTLSVTPATATSAEASAATLSALRSWSPFLVGIAIEGVRPEATQAEMEAATASAAVATPVNTKFHPGVAKAWMKYDQLTADTLQASHNVSSVTDDNSGTIVVNFTTNFSSIHYGISTAVRPNNRGTSVRHVIVDDTAAPAAANATLVGLVGGNSETEFTSLFASFFGDQ